MTRSRNTVTLLATVIGLFLASAVSAAGPGDRIKLACPAGAGAADACRAVYYWGGDGDRHAFPNQRVYATWFADFGGVQTVTADTMATLHLGRNVTYRPGLKLVKLTTLNDVYAVDLDGTLRPIASEYAATQVFGANWNKGIDDLPDAFFPDYHVGTPIQFTTDFNAAARLAAVPTIDAAIGATYALKNVVTPRGTFGVQVITLDRAKYRMQTMVAAKTDRSNGCAVLPLAEYAALLGAHIGINGAYACPPDYAECSGKTNSFLWPIFDSPSGQMRNAGAIPFHHGPIMVSSADDKWQFYRSTPDFSMGQFLAQTGSLVDAAVANFPALIDGGTIVVESEPMLDDGQRNTKATRVALGISSDKIFLVVAKSATVIDLASIMQALGAHDAINLDGGGTTAMLYGGVYKAGPGRLLSNAIVFVRRIP